MIDAKLQQLVVNQPVLIAIENVIKLIMLEKIISINVKLAIN